MNILAIDTASEYLSLAIGINSKSVSEKACVKSCYILEKVGNLQSEFIIPKIQELLKQQGLAINDIDVIAYNQGPGSFTGVRIGLSVAIGIAIGLEIKLIPIPAFAIVAYDAIKYAQQHLYLARSSTEVNDSVPPDIHFNSIIVGIDARLNQIYLAGINLPNDISYHDDNETYQHSNIIHNMNYCINPQVADPSDITNILNAHNLAASQAIFVGNGFNQYLTQLPDEIKNRVNGLLLSLEYPNALNMVELVNSGQYHPVDTSTADVLYLRNKIALNLAEQKLMKPKIHEV
jgi:tRNA threonylcarbamoyl adenosine modification protein YeaZ